MSIFRVTNNSRWHMKKYLSLTLLVMCLVTGCSSNKSTSVNNNEICNTETPETSTQKENIPTVSSNVGITLDSVGSEIELQEEYYTEIPAFYQTDYSDIPFGTSTIGESGNLLTCLSMIESYVTYKTVTPDMFVQIHEDLCANGTNSLTEDSIYSLAKALNKTVTKESFEIENVTSYLLDRNGILLLHIPHNSIYGMSSSYLIITGLNENGVEVRDPVRENIDTFANSNYNKPTYSIYDLCIAASTDSIIYVLCPEE